jgi:hypothetical protein
MRSVMERVNVILEAPHKSQAPVDHGVHAGGLVTGKPPVAHNGEGLRGSPLFFLSHAAQLQRERITSMWALVIFTVAATGASTVATLEFATQDLCLLAEKRLESLTEPVVLEGLVRYEVVATCVQTKEEEAKKKK